MGISIATEATAPNTDCTFSTICLGTKELPSPGSPSPPVFNIVILSKQEDYCEASTHTYTLSSLSNGDNTITVKLSNL